MLKRSRSTNPVWIAASVVAIIAVVAVIILLIINLSNSNQAGNAANVTSTPSPVISVSSSGKYQLLFSDSSGLDLKTPSKTVNLLSDPVVDDSTTFDKTNVVWSQDESELVITFVNIKEQNAYIAFYKNDGTLISKTLLDQAFYGVNLDQAFPPVASSDGKYIAVQTELIHKISIFDFSGVLLKTLPTKYDGVELFSDAMYALENGTYSPFLDYKWNDDNSGVLYRFQGTTTYYEVKL